VLTDEKITTLDGETDDHKCGFGKWLHGEGCSPFAPGFQASPCENDLSPAIPPDTACCGSFLLDSQGGFLYSPSLEKQVLVSSYQLRKGGKKWKGKYYENWLFLSC
jgi:hypothetical protein